MRYVSTYEKFLEKKELDSLLERFQFIFESEDKQPLNIEVQSEEEILQEAPEDEKSKIEDIIAKHFPEAKGKIDLDAKKEGEEKDVEKTNEEEGILFAVTVASLIPVCIEAVGSFANLLKRNFGFKGDDKSLAKIGLMNNTIDLLKKLQSGDEFAVATDPSTGKKWKRGEWDSICNNLAQKLEIPELRGGNKEHKHADKFAPNLAMNKSNREVPKEEKKAEADRLAAAKKGEGERTLFKDDTAHFIGLEIKKIKNKRDELFGFSWANKMKEFAHKLHSMYTSPIRLALYGLSLISKRSSKLRDEAFRTKIANVIYAITMVTLAGIGIWQSLSSLAGVTEVTGVVLKGIESGVNTSEIRKQAISLLMG